MAHKNKKGVLISIMLQLEKSSGLPLELDDSLKLVFPNEVMVHSQTSRTIDDLQPFLYENASAPNPLIYRVFHDVGFTVHASRIHAAGLRYDVTAINTGTIQFDDGTNEFFRTAGHYHKPSPEGVRYPEIYEVLAGRGRWIIQRYETDPAQIDEIYLVEAGPGEKICVPPSFGHITINAETEPLVIANVIADKVGYDYEPYKILRGAAARLLASEAPSMIEIESNRNYRVVPPLRKLKPKKDWYNGYFDPLYTLLASDPAKFSFLAKPETYRQDFFSIDRLYQEIK